MPRQRAHAVDSDDEESEVQDQVTEAIQFGRQAITQLGKDILPHCDQRMQQEVSGRLSEAFKKLIRAGIVYNKCNVIVKEVAQGIQVDNDANQTTILKACDNIETLSRDGVDAFKASISDDQIARDKSFVELMDNLREAVEESADPSAFDPQPDEESEEDGSGNDSEVDVDDEESEATQVITTKDPLTMKLLKHPAMNIHCKHIYERKTMLDHISKTRAKCPIPGCSNNQFIRKEDLKSDAQLTKQVVQKQKEEAKRGKRR
jgi:hypothetical protein